MILYLLYCLTRIKMTQEKLGNLLKLFTKIKQNRSLPKYFKNGHNTITDNVEIPNYFNIFFTNR